MVNILDQDPLFLVSILVITIILFYILNKISTEEEKKKTKSFFEILNKNVLIMICGAFIILGIHILLLSSGR